jgi:uncharacterized protein YceK
MKDLTLISAIVLLASGCASTYTAPVADAPYAGGTYARYQPAAPDPTPGAGGQGGYGGGATVVR